MLDRRTVDRLRGVDTAGHPVVSVYLGVSPDPGQLRSTGTRLKALLHPYREPAEASDGERVRSLRKDFETVVAMADRVSLDQGRGTAIFVCGAVGLEEAITLPVPVPDRAMVDTAPYLGPLEAALEQSRRYCAVVIGRRIASIYRFHMGSLESWEEIAEEEVRKHNFGGFLGYSERRTRAHAGAVAQRLCRAVAARLLQLQRAGEFDLLAVGGSQGNIEGLLAELPGELRSLLVGTFVIDVRRAPAAEIAEQCAKLALGHARQVDDGLVADLLEAAGARGRGVLGLDRAMDASNQRAIDKLLVGAVPAVPGVACGGCGWLARSGGTCVSCGAGTHPVADLYEAVAEVARAEGGLVHYLLAGAGLGDAGIGALVRFGVPTAGGGASGAANGR
jgi:peptide subunit release factor 1 (eRF1)